MHRNTLNIIVILLSFTYASSWVGKTSPTAKVIKPTVVSSNIERTHLDFEFTGYHSLEVETPDGAKSIINLEGGSSILEWGTPDLDKWTSSIVIPDDGVTSIEVLSSSYHDFYNIDVASSKGNLSRTINPNEIPFEYGISYQSDEFYPGIIAELGDPYVLRDLSGQNIILYPLQYNPITKTLRLYTEIEIEIVTTGSSTGDSLNRKNQDKRISKEYDSIYGDLFLNYNNDTRFNYILDQGNMLIISDAGFMSAMQPFVDWKNRKGIPTEMVNVSSIGSSSSAIENYVDDYYRNQGLTYLLLVGDISQIPSPTVSGSASDPSYGFIDGNDAYSEIIVGRFSGNNPGEISTQVERSINYELYPQSGASWYDNALGIASNQGPGYGGMSDDDFNDFLWDTLLSGYTYDNYQSEYDGSGGTASGGVSAINNGVSIINYTGHGSISSWGNGAPLSTSQVNSLTNNDKLPFVITVGCNVGEFQSTSACFTETWQRATNNGEPTGSVAHLGSTISQSWEPPMHGQWAMNAIITESYDNNISRSLGGITTNGCMHMNEAQGSSGINETNYWTFFGDPSIVIRTDQPTNLNLNYNEIILIGQTEFVVDIGVDGVLAALSRDGELLGSAYSIGGVAVIELDGATDSPGILDLVVTGYNKFPYESNVTVLTPDGAFVTVNNVEVDYGADNSITPGEVVEVNLTLENLGNDNSGLIDLYLTINDPYVDVIDGATSFNSLGDGQTEQVTFSFIVSNDAPYAHSFNLDLSMLSDENDWNTSLNLTLEALVESFESGNFSDLEWNLSGNADWSIDSDEYYSGSSSAQSGTIGDNTVSTLELTMDIVNSGTISFHKRISCEAAGSFTGNYYDYLAFYIDGVEKGRWAGEVDWSQNSYPVSSGEHTFTWTFYKDTDSSDNVDSNEDAVWIDNITFPPVASDSNSMLGDVNGDMVINVLDVIQTVNMALGLQAPDYSSADLNQDNEINILDIVQIVGIILDGRFVDATKASIYKDNDILKLSSDGFIGGVQLTIKHGDDFSINLTDDALYADYITDSYETKVIIVAPETNDLLSATGEYEVLESIIANSNSEVASMTPEIFYLEKAYPNPFNPSTNMRVYMPFDNSISIKAYDLMGREVAQIYNGYIQTGHSTFNWDASNLSSGVYIIKAVSGNFITSQKVMLLK